MTKFLESVRVVELDEGLAEFAGKLLADAGADVIKVEPPNGAPSRASGPFGPDGASLQFEYYNTSKRSVMIDLDTAEGLSQLRTLLSTADVLLDGLAVGRLESLGLGADVLEKLNPSVVYVSVTPFGDDGPWSTLEATDLVQLALGGIMASCGYDDGTTESPIAPTGGHSRHVAGMMAATAVLGGLLLSDRHGAQFASVAAHEALAVSTEMSVPFWLYQQRHVERHTARHAMPADTPRWQHLCRDGKYLLALPLYIDDARFAALVEWFDSEGMAEDLGDDLYRHSETRERHMFHVVDVIGRFCAVHDSEDLFREAQARRLPWAPINAPDELIDDPHFTSVRDSFVTVVDGDTVKIQPHVPFMIGQDAPPAPAPRLGEHTDTVLATTTDPQAGQPVGVA